MADTRTWFPVSSGILTIEHCRAIGPALWVFLWFIHRERKPKDSPAGLIDDGRAITYQEIAQDLGIPFGTIRRYVDQLEATKYIRSEQLGTAGRGKRYFITNPIRWNLQRLSNGEQSQGERVSINEQSVAGRVLTGEQSQSERVLMDEQAECSKSGERLLKFEHSNKEQITKEHQRTKSKHKSPKTPFPENFGISTDLQRWADEHHYNRLKERLEWFRDHALAKGWEYVNWERAFMNSIREDWAKLNHANGNGTYGNGTPNRAVQHQAQLLAERDRAIAMLAR